MKHNICYTIAATVFLTIIALPVHAQVTPNDPDFIAQTFFFSKN